MIFLEKVSTLAACVFVILLYSSPVLSATLTQKQEKVIHVENQPFELQCIVTGTQAEIEKITIKWNRPDPTNSNNEILILENDPNRSITVKKSEGMFTSTLRLRGPPDIQTLRFYQCFVEPSIPGKISQHSFPIKVVKAKAVPKIHPVELEPGKFGESVVLNCSVSYDNGNFKADKYRLILSWIRDGKLLTTKTSEYKVGNHTEEIQFPVVVSSFRDGGDYICHWNLTDKSSIPNFILGNYTVVLPISPYLNGPQEKEVKDTAGSDVKLTCDVLGYPIKYEWHDEENSLIDGVSRFRPEDDVLYIDDIDYEDRKKYLCLGIGRNGTITQTIILRVKDPLAPLWPFIGILVEAIVVAAIILLSEYYKKQTRNEKDGAVTKTEITEQPSTSQT